jgi:hypothetical protein
MLTKISTCFAEGETFDISNLNIYWDLRTKQFRHLFFCDECGVKVGCFCYEHLDVAIDDVESGCLCDECGTKALLYEMDVDEIIEGYFSEDKYSQVITYGKNLAAGLLDETLEVYGVSREEIQSGNIDWDLITEMLVDCNEYQKLKDFTVSLMTEDEKQSMYMDSFDYYDAKGFLCDL